MQFVTLLEIDYTLINTTNFDYMLLYGFYKIVIYLTNIITLIIITNAVLISSACTVDNCKKCSNDGKCATCDDDYDRTDDGKVNHN